MKSRLLKIAAALGIALMVMAAGGCSPERAMDFGPVGEINTPPTDKLSRQILHDFDGRDFELGDNDRQAEVRLSNWKPGYHVVMPFWLGVNPLYPGFLRPTVGHIYVMSESDLVRPLGNHDYLIRAGSKLFKSDTVFEAKHTHYLDAGKMLPTVVRFVGTRIITVPRDAPATGTITERVPVLREVSLPMHVNKPEPGYAKFQVENAAAAPSPTPS
jgi:hypothetical protein